jgi:acyl dehydratase
MAFAYDKIINFRRELEQTYTVRDTILYALGVGAGIDADTPEKLSFVYEGNLRALPTMACVLAAPGFWQREPEFGIAWQQILHGEQSTILHKTLPVEGRVTSVVRVEAIYDKGSDKGALICSVRELFDGKGGDLLATIRQSSFLRGNGGQGGLTHGAPRPHPLPENTAPNMAVVLPTRPEQALIYRLSGDYNPLHADPEVARQGGFAKPILHGLSTYGIVGRALIAAMCKGDPCRLRRLDVRFSGPVFPGQTLSVEVWDGGAGVASFRAKVHGSDTVAINNGYAEYD